MSTTPQPIPQNRPPAMVADSAAPANPSIAKRLIPPIILTLLFWAISGGLLFFKGMNPPVVEPPEAVVPAIAGNIDDAEKDDGKVPEKEMDAELEKDPLAVGEEEPDEKTGEEPEENEEKAEEEPQEDEASVTIRILTVPDGAIAKDKDGIDYGVTPMNLLLEKSDDEMEMILEREGFEPMTISFVPSEAVTKTLNLIPTGAKAKKSVTAVKKKNTVTKKYKKKTTKKVIKKKKTNVGILLDDDEPVKKKKKVIKKKKEDSGSIDIFDL